MCGIVGAVGFTDKAVLKRMKDALRHRGPDQEGTFLDHNVMLGHRRLSILDLSIKGRQPMSNADGTTHVVFNGEIYNYRELKSELESMGYAFASESDTEVLVHGHDAWKENLPQRLDGDFAYAIWDSTTQALHLARDTFGVDPLYYTQVGSTFLFASEAKALFQYDACKAELNESALDEYLALQYVPNPDTLFKGVYKVRPGQQLKIEKGKITKKFFKKNHAPLNKTISMAQAVDRVNALMSRSVKKRLQSDVPLGAYLSGGLDSSWIVAHMSEHTRPHTFSVEFGTQDDETEFVDEIVSKYDTKHETLRVDSNRFDLLPTIAWHLDAPPADIAALPTYLMAEKTKEKATVVFTGDGGDEVFAGYARYKQLPLAEKTLALPSVWAKAAQWFWPGPKASRLHEAVSSKSRTELFLAYVSAFSKKEQRGIGRNFSGIHHAVEGHFTGQESYLSQLQSFDQAKLLPDDYLMKVNKSSLAFGVEPRVPFLDLELVAYVNQLPDRFKADAFSTKILQRKAMKKMGVPERIVKRKKHGFVPPVRKWLDDGLESIAVQSFESLDNRRLLKRGVGQDLLKQFKQSSGKNYNYYYRQFCVLLGLETWMQVFIDPDKPKKPGT